MSVRCYHGDRRVDGLDRHADRGLVYGDGLFETMRVHAGCITWWDHHWARFVRGAGRLRIALPASNFIAHEVAELAREIGDGVLRLIASRGQGARGYFPSIDSATYWQLSQHRLPAVLPRAWVLRWCDTRCAIQPLLAGIKHCNRLEQVLARAEWHDPDAPDTDADEGLMLTIDGDVIGATAANLFIYGDDGWVTPAVDRSGVAGVCRALLIHGLAAKQARVTPADIEAASAVFLCNAVRGILPVGRLGTRTWSSRPALDQARRVLAALHPAFPEIS